MPPGQNVHLRAKFGWQLYLSEIVSLKIKSKIKVTLAQLTLLGRKRNYLTCEAIGASAQLGQLKQDAQLVRSMTVNLTLSAGIASTKLHLLKSHLLKQLTSLYYPAQLWLEQYSGPGLMRGSLLRGLAAHQLIHLLQCIQCICCHILAPQSFLQLLYVAQQAW